MKSKAVTLMRAGEKARRAEARVAEARKALTKAERARDKADGVYLALVRDSFREMGTGATGREGAAVQTA